MTTLPSLRTFAIDKAHSEVTFQVRYLITKVRGRFSEFEGEIQFDEADPASSSVSLTIQASSIDTNEPQRDTHLRSGDFLSVEEYPTITFKSTQVTPKSPTAFDVKGSMTLHAATKEITLPVSYLGTAKDPWGKERAGFESSITLNRKDFGLHWNAVVETGGFLIGDDVHVTLSIQGILQE